MFIDENWAKLTPEQKRQKRFDLMLKPRGIKFDSTQAEKNYHTRMQRLIDVYQVKEPDRVPVSFMASVLGSGRYGINGKTAMNDYNKLVEVWGKFNDEYSERLDAFTAPMMVLPAPVYDILDFKLYVYPGHGLPDSALSHQFVETEIMRDDEYDWLIRDPSDYFLRVYMPRVFGVFKPLEQLHPLFSTVELPHSFFSPFASPEFKEMWQKFDKIAGELSRWGSIVGRYSMRGVEMGFPVMSMGAFGKAPFDTLGDTLRGTRGIMKDMYSQPQKLLAALDRIADMTINAILTTANKTGGLIASFPLHKAADGWMSQKQFDTFYWASFKKVIDACINEGIIVSNFAEGGYNSRLETVNVFPKGSVHWWFDLTDMAKAKKVLGANCSIQGNVPASLLVTGTPKDVKEYCKRTIDICAPGGGFVLSPGANSDEAKIENIIAMVDAAKEYGVYKK